MLIKARSRLHDMSLYCCCFLNISSITRRFAKQTRRTDNFGNRLRKIALILLIEYKHIYYRIRRYIFIRFIHIPSFLSLYYIIAHILLTRKRKKQDIGFNQGIITFIHFTRFHRSIFLRA